MNPPADKARQQLLARIDKAMKQIDDALSCFQFDKDKADSAREAKALQAKIDATARDASPAATKTLAALLKTAEALAPTIRQRSYDMFARRRRIELQGQLNGALAAMLLDVGKIQDPVLTRSMFAEQAKMKAQMNKAEKLKSDLEAVDTMGDIEDEMPGLQKRMQAALAVSAWLAGGYKAMMKLTEAAIASVPSERCQRVLRAEIDFVEAAKNAALARLDVKAAENATVPGLRRLNTVASRVAAAWPALDREMMRVGKMLKEAGASDDLLMRLRKMAQDKAAGWPRIRAADDFDKTLDAFERDLAELAAAAKQAHKAGPVAASH
ncbi:MAG: hypothetical protein ABJA61_02030 [Caldimonas sp.]